MSESSVSTLCKNPNQSRRCIVIAITLIDAMLAKKAALRRTRSLDSPRSIRSPLSASPAWDCCASNSSSYDQIVGSACVECAPDLDQAPMRKGSPEFFISANEPGRGVFHRVEETHASTLIARPRSPVAPCPPTLLKASEVTLVLSVVPTLVASYVDR